MQGNIESRSGIPCCHLTNSQTQELWRSASMFQIVPHPKLPNRAQPFHVSQSASLRYIYKVPNVVTDFHVESRQYQPSLVVGTQEPEHRPRFAEGPNFGRLIQSSKFRVSGALLAQIISDGSWRRTWRNAIHGSGIHTVGMPTRK
jgi:hypothetical protein